MEDQNKPAQLKAPMINRIAWWQSLCVVVIVIMLWQWQKAAALAILYGAAIFLIPNSYFVWQSFRYNGAVHAKLIAHSMYKGQTTKFVLTIVMFGALFKLVKPDSVWLVFISYGLNVLFHSLAANQVLKKTQKF